MNKISIYKKNNMIWFVSFILLQFLFLFLALIINPYRLLPFSITIPRFNDVKPRLYDNQRFIKVFDISRIKPKTLLLGSSRVLWGIDPKHPLLQQPGYLPVYNAGVLGPPIYEIKLYFDHALSVQPNLKRVILNVDFYALNAKFDGRRFLPEKSFNKQKMQLLSKNTAMLFDFKAALETVKYSVLRQPVKTLRDDGRLIPAPIEAFELYKDFFTLHTGQINLQSKNPTSPATQGPMKNELYQPFSLSEQSMQALKYIIEKCKQKHIELIIYIPPTYTEAGLNTELGIYHDLGIWNDYKNFLSQLASMHPFWSFLSWNEVTTNKNNYIDTSHFIFQVGDKIIEKIMTQTTSKMQLGEFGYYVDANNVDHFLNLLDQDFTLHNPTLKY